MKKQWYVWVVILVAVVAGFLAASWIMKPQKVSTTAQPTVGTVASPAAAADIATYTNAKGQQWSIPKGDDSFTVASQEVYPRFVSGDVDPVDVSTGETQHMSFVVRDNVPITKAWAEVENDKSTDTIPLASVSSSPVSYQTIKNQKYLVDNAGELVINDGSNKDSKIADVIQSLFQKAEAEQAIDYSFTGSWVVHDTRTINYHTTFYVEDASGRTAEAVLVWSDPCTAAYDSGSGYYDLNSGKSDCNLTVTWGLDGAGEKLNLKGHAVNMSGSSANLVYNSGNSIIFSTAGSAVNISSGDQIVKANLFYTDADGDGYAPNNIMTYNTASSLRGYVRVSAALGTNDCDDSNNEVYPGEGLYYTSPISDGSSQNRTYNYNCSGVLSEELLPSGSETSLAYPGTQATSTVDSYWNGSSCINLGSASTTLLVPIGMRFNGATASSTLCGSTTNLLANSSTYYGGSGCTGASYVLPGGPVRIQACNGGESY